MDQLAYSRLQEAWQWIQLGQHDHAANLLTVLLASDSDNVEAWWMLAVASSDPNTRRRALRSVLRLRPDDPRAWRMFNGLGARPAMQELRPVAFRQPLLIAGGQASSPFYQASVVLFPPRQPPLRRRAPKRDLWRTPRWVIYALVSAAMAGMLGCGLLLCTVTLAGWSLNSRWLGGRLPAATATARPGVPSVSLRGGLRYEQWRDGRLDVPGQLDGYNFSGRHGDQVAVQVSALELMTLQPVIGLYGPAQTLLMSSGTPDSDAAIRLSYALPCDCEFVLIVAGQALTTGPYRLMLRHVG